MDEVEYNDSLSDKWCPLCKDWHNGKYQVCDDCQEAASNEYDYAEDDMNYMIANKN